MPLAAKPPKDIAAKLEVSNYIGDDTLPLIG